VYDDRVAGQSVLGAIVLTVLAAAAGGPGQSAPARLAPGDTEITLRHGGRERRYLAHLPKRLPATPAPLLIAFHGGGSNVPGFRAYAGLDALADREGFIVVYPSGTGPLRNLLLTFHAGNNCCGYALTQRVDDVGFAAAVIEDVARRANVDRRRVYATGHSNGGIMAYRLAADIHSVDDPRALYGGGVGPPFPGTDNRVTHASVQAGLDQWIARNGCREQPSAGETRRTPASGAGARAGAGRDPEQTATRLEYGPCTSGMDVVHWKLTGVGHGWPGGPALRERLSGPGTTLVKAADEAWAFVSRYTR
jgi:polyhydroxybutyrate depolymerase